MLRHRVIPVLLLQNGGLVKTRKFSEPVYLGDPVNVINIFNEKEVDELILLDIEASRRGGSIDFETIREIAEECFMPLAYGGGITSLHEMERLFALGVEKVILNRSLSDRKLVREAVARFGAQSIVASVDIVRKNGEYRLYDYLKGRSRPGGYLEHLRKIEALGVGEIFVNDVDRDGTMAGYDLDLMRRCSAAVRVPVIACGGAGSLEDMRRLVIETEVSAPAAGSMFVFYGRHRAVLITYPEYEVLEKMLEGPDV